MFLEKTKQSEEIGGNPMDSELQTKVNEGVLNSGFLYLATKTQVELSDILVFRGRAHCDYF